MPQNTQSQPAIEGRPVEAFERLEDGRLLCTACPRACKLKDGQRGLCFVRARKGDGMVLTTMNKSSGFCIDPIEKKPLNHFLPGSSVFSFGTAGCNLACSYCQNWSISTSRNVDTLGQEATGDMIAKTAYENGCRSIAFTYNDPVIFAEYAVEVADAARERGLKSVAVSAGYVEGKPREMLFSKMDAANIDLKAFTQDYYRQYCKGRLDVVLDTIDYLVNELKIWVELTTLVIPGLNDSVDEIAGMSDWVLKTLGPNVPLHFSAFRPEHRMLDRPPTPHETLIRARQTALKAGLNYVYIGNIPDTGRQSTWCPCCRAKVVERTGYRLTLYALDEKGHCLHCHHPVSGVYEGRLDLATAWGPKRQAVHIASPFPPEEKISVALP
jgi:pyruvate formate lyase activating enzyme